jgi:hypothetical protein
MLATGLPLVRSNHPTLEETQAAVAMLRAAQRTSQPILDGYVGHGLVPDVGLCTFRSKGLGVLRFGKPVVVLSYHDLV